MKSGLLLRSVLPVTQDKFDSLSAQYIFFSSIAMKKTFWTGPNCYFYILCKYNYCQTILRNHRISKFLMFHIQLSVML